MARVKRAVASKKHRKTTLERAKGYYGNKSRSYRAANEQVLQTISERRARKLLGDITEFVLIGAEDQDWLNNVWLPKTMEAGLRVAALVTPNFYFNRVAVENVTRKLDPTHLQVAFFATRDEAREWLKNT